MNCVRWKWQAAGNRSVNIAVGKHPNPFYERSRAWGID